MSDLLPFQHNKPLKEVSTFCIGGPARLFVEIDSEKNMELALAYATKEKIPFFVLGKGSNCLFEDRGFDGLVIHNKIAHLKIDGTTVDVGSGYSFSLLGFKTAKMGLSGLEFASGIPGSVGGAVFMNAGANGLETADHLTQVSFIDTEGRFCQFLKDDLQFSYRHSIFHEKKGVITSAKFSLIPCDKARSRQLNIIEYRTSSQPTQDASAGCAFRNPLGASAGALIEKSGLKGFSIGGAEVSLKHANFIVNRSNASAQDVLDLVKLVQEKVKESSGITLEMEIRCVPYQIL